MTMLTEAPDLEQLLAKGRRALAAKRADEAARKEAEGRQEQAAKDRSFFPLGEAVARILPACWLPHIDWRRDGFAGHHTTHTIRVNLPGLAPILVGFGADEWVDGKANIGHWTLGTHPYRVANYYHHFGEEADSPALEKERDWREADNLYVALAMAEESEADRVRIAEECERRNDEREHRAKVRAEKPAPTLEQRLVAVLREFVQEQVPHHE